MSENNSPAPVGAEKRRKFHTLFIWYFHARSERRGNSR